MGILFLSFLCSVCISFFLLFVMGIGFVVFIELFIGLFIVVVLGWFLLGFGMYVVLVGRGLVGFLGFVE